MASLFAPKRATATSVSCITSRLLSASKLPFPTRHFSTASGDPSSNHDNKQISYDLPVVVLDQPHRFSAENPFQVDGPREFVEIDEVREGTLIRLALPGACANLFKVWAEKNSVLFEAKGEVGEVVVPERKFAGSIEFRCENKVVENVSAVMKNGILRVFVPNTTVSD